jgi:cytochrome c oxidase cbb3-type subunit 3
MSGGENTDRASAKAQAGATGTADVETGHDYDGIREFDNPLPRWWLMTFYGTVIFAIGYWFYYHTAATGDSQMTTYQKEITAAQKEEDQKLQALEAQGKGVNEEQLLALSKDAAAVARGAAVFKQNCLACHGDRGQGVVGPNLTDRYFLHGAKAKDVYQVIGNGVLDKGMPAWRTILGAAKVQDVTAFVLELRGKNLPGKPAEGVAEDEAARAKP